MIPLTPQEALSGIFGSISLASWIFLLVPQLVENYRSSSADGISLAFLFVWFIGDVTNLIGAGLANLVPTVIALAVYFCFADTALVLQCLYYNAKNARLAKQAEAEREGNGGEAGRSLNNENAEATEDQPLLTRRTSVQSISSIGLPGSHIRHRTRSTGSLIKIPETNGHSISPTSSSQTSRFLRSSFKNVAAILAVCAVGSLGWFIAYKAEVWKPALPPSRDPPNSPTKGTETPITAAILGYASAVAYLGARIPQIYKNWRD